MTVKNQRTREESFRSFLLNAQCTLISIIDEEYTCQTKFLKKAIQLKENIIVALKTWWNDEVYMDLDKQAEIVLWQYRSFTRMKNFISWAQKELLDIKFKHNDAQYMLGRSIKLQKSQTSWIIYHSNYHYKEIDIPITEKLIEYIQKNIIDLTIDDYDIDLSKKILHHIDSYPWPSYWLSQYPDLIALLY